MNETTNAAEWEAAWGEYVEALSRFDRTFPNRHKRGCTREHNHSKRIVREARERLAKIDPTFCENEVF